MEKTTVKQKQPAKQSDAPRLKVAVTSTSGGGNPVRANPEKAAKYQREAQEAQRKRLVNRELAPPRASQRSISAKSLLSAKVVKPRYIVMKNNFGMTDPAERAARRAVILKKNLQRRHHMKYGPRHAETGSEFITPEDRKMLDELKAKGHIREEHEEAKGESWWEGLLDTAIDLAPKIIPLVAGMGDYSIDNLSEQTLPVSNSLAACFSEGEMCSEVPSIHSVGERTRFTHREYIGDVYSTTEKFSTVTFRVNAADHTVFPWGSRSMENYDKYNMEGAMFVFESEGSEYTNSVGLGYVALGSQYDLHERAFASKKEMFQSQFSVARKPSETFAHWIECNPGVLGHSELLTRPAFTQQQDTLDPQLADWCRTTLAVGGHTANDVVIGELWITYDATAVLPRTEESLGSSISYSAFGATGISQETPLGEQGPMYEAGSTWKWKTKGQASMTFPDSFPAGTYLMWVFWMGGPQNVTYVFPEFTINKGTLKNPVQFAGCQAGTGGTYTATLNVNGIGANYLITHTGQDGTRIDVRTDQLVAPNDLYQGFIRVTIHQIPTGASDPSCAILDYRGQDSDARYKKMMDQFLPANATALEEVGRSTSKYELVYAVGGSCIRSLPTKKCTPINQKTCDALRLVTDEVFDIMCDTLVAPKEHS